MEDNISKVTGKELSLEDLDHVAGGAPAYLDFEGMQLTRAEFLNLLGSIRSLDVDQAESILLRSVRPHYTNLPTEQILNAYRVYGAEVFKALDNPAKYL